MRFMILIKADKNTEAGVMPSEHLLADMGARKARASSSRERSAPWSKGHSPIRNS